MEFSEMPVTMLLIAANVVFSMIGFSNKDLENKTIGWPYYTKRQNQYYRFITAGFLHADWMHLIFNMFTFFFFGAAVENIFNNGLGGPVAYLALYFAGLIVANIPSFIKHKDDPDYRSLGASGAVSAVVFAALLFNPWGRIELYGFLKMSFVVFAVLYIIFCVYMSKQNADNVNHDAHLWGSVFGLAFTLVLLTVQRTDIFPYLLEELKKPSLFGREEAGAVLNYLWSTR